MKGLARLGALVAVASLVAACGGGASATQTTTTAAQPPASAQTTTTPPAAPAPSTTAPVAPPSGATAPPTGSTVSPISVPPRPRRTQPQTTVTVVRLPPAAPPDRHRRVALCLRTTARLAVATLTGPERRALRHLCRIAGSHRAARVRAAERRICLMVVRDSGLPAAAAAAESQSCPLARPAPSGAG